MNPNIRVDGGGPLVGKNMNLVPSLGKMGGVLGNKLFRTSIVHVFLSDDGDFHYRDEMRPIIW